jgi:hypothetical protein
MHKHVGALLVCQERCISQAVQVQHILRGVHAEVTESSGEQPSEHFEAMEESLPGHSRTIMIVTLHSRDEFLAL